MYTIDDLPSWYDNWKTGGLGEDDRENENEYEKNIIRCDICYGMIEHGDEILVEDKYWCGKCADG